MTETAATHPAETQPTETLGRRELNKARTREAIVEALRALVGQQPIHKVTVDQLAERAGISRRTFFNYYAGIPAVVSEVIGDNTQGLADMITEIDTEQSPFVRLRGIIQTVGLPRELIEWMGLIHAHGCHDEPAAMTFERIVWADKATWLEDTLSARLPDGADELYVATLASTIMNTVATATRFWALRRDLTEPLDETAIADFNHQVDRALALAESGWTSPAGNVARD